MNLELEVNNLTVSFSHRNDKKTPVKNVNFSLQAGESLGIVGPSGCGKTTLIQSLPLLLPAHAKIEQGSIFFQGKNLLSLSEKELRTIRGRKIGFVFQDPKSALNPTMTIGTQITETLLNHKLMSRSEARNHARQLLHLVGMETTPLSYYPHQLSGGMRQRVALCIALSATPSLLIADEPTTALDEATKNRIFNLLNHFRTTYNMSLILVSHDPSVIDSLCNRILYMEANH